MKGRGGALVLGALWVAASAVGCGHVESRSIAFRPLEPGPPAAADVYVGRVPARPYAELGLVQAVGTGSQATTPAVLRSLRARGQSMGCDAIVNVAAGAGELSAHAIGVCVRWVQPAMTDAVEAAPESR